MALKNDLISQFAKLANETKTTKTETTAYGTAKIQNGTVFVKIDGSDRLTPVQTAVDVEDDERVIVSVKDHSVTITGNTSSPAARTDTVKEQNKKIDEFDIILAHKVTTDELSVVNATIQNLNAIAAKYENMSAVTAEIETLQAKFAELQYLTADEVTALNAEFESLKSTFASFTDLSTEDLNAANAEIDNLIAYTAKFTYVETELLKAYNADIGKLNVDKLDVNWANIDFANINIATLGELFAKSGIIGNITTENGTVTGELIGVTIKGDMIDANTIVADKLVVQGNDGIYYKLNFESGSFAGAEEVPTDGLHGSVIVANSITADKVSVSDLVAFGATIGGFHIIGGDENTPGAIYSGVKASIDNGTRGSYLDNEGQFAFGDSFSYVKYYKLLDEDGNQILDEDGNPIYKLSISADSIVFGGTGRSAEELADLADVIKIGSYKNPDTGESKPSVELSEENSTEKLLLTNENVVFVDGENEGTKIKKDSVKTDTLTVNKEFRQGPLAWGFRSNGNYGLMWKGVTE